MPEHRSMRRIEYAKLGSPEYYAYVALKWREMHTIYAKDIDGKHAVYVRFETETADANDGSSNTNCDT